MTLSDCDLYPGKPDSDGYCRVRDLKTGSLRYAHRHVWEETHGVDLARYDVIRHTCQEKSCVNPRHLRLITRWDHRREHGGGEVKCPHGVAPKCLGCRRTANRDAQVRWKNKQWNRRGCRQCANPAVMGKGACAKHLEREAQARQVRRRALRAGSA